MMTLTRTNKAGRLSECGSLALGSNEFWRQQVVDPVVALGIIEARKRKVSRLRRQLAAGTYNVQSRLDAVVDRVLQDLAN